MRRPEVATEAAIGQPCVNATGIDAEAAVAVRTQSNHTVHLHKVVSTDPGEVRLYCYSEERAHKERIVERAAARFEAG